MKTSLTLTLAVFIAISAFGQKKVELKLNLQPNKVYRVRSTSQQDITQTVMGQQKSIEAKSFTTISVKPIDIKDTVLDVEVRFDTIGYSTTMPKIDVASYKEGKISETDPMSVMNLMLHRLSTRSLDVKLSITGKVLEISNIKAIADSVLAGTDTLKGQTAMIVNMQAKNMISKESLGGMIEMVTAYLPGKIVKTGDKWDSRIKISSNGIGIYINTTYKLKKLSNGQAQIKGQGTNEPASSEPITMNGAQVTYAVRGLGESDLTVDTQTGWIIKGSSRSHSEGTMEVKAQGQDFQMPMQIDSNSQIEALP